MTQVVLQAEPRQRTEAEQLLLTRFVFVCLELWLRQLKQKQSLFSRARGHSHTYTEALCLEKQRGTHPLGFLPN